MGIIPMSNMIPAVVSTTFDPMPSISASNDWFIGGAPMIPKIPITVQKLAKRSISQFTALNSRFMG
jgi:hypothetical protein